MFMGCSSNLNIKYNYYHQEKFPPLFKDRYWTRMVNIVSVRVLKKNIIVMYNYKEHFPVLKLFKVQIKRVQKLQNNYTDLTVFIFTFCLLSKNAR